MKKVILTLSCAMFLAGVCFSCGNKEAEEVLEEEAVEEVVEEAEAVVEEAVAVEEDAPAVNKEEILSKARQAGQAKCNCYQKDAAHVEACIKAILEQSYAAYKEDVDFQKEMKAEYDKCIKEKASAAAKEVANEGAKAAASAISKKLGGNQ